MVARSGDVAVADMLKFSILFCSSVYWYVYSCPAAMSIVQNGSDLKWWRLGGVSWKEREAIEDGFNGSWGQKKWDNLGKPIPSYRHTLDFRAILLISILRRR